MQNFFPLGPVLIYVIIGLLIAKPFWTNVEKKYQEFLEAGKIDSNLRRNHDTLVNHPFFNFVLLVMVGLFWLPLLVIWFTKKDDGK